MTEELEKAIQEATESGLELIRKSQMLLDFSAPAHDHHIAYTRTNAAGTASQIKQKGMQPYKSAATATKGMKPGDKLVDAKEGGVFIHRENPDSRTARHELHGPKEIKKFGNKSNPTWQELVTEVPAAAPTATGPKDAPNERGFKTGDKVQYYDPDRRTTTKHTVTGTRAQEVQLDGGYYYEHSTVMKVPSTAPVRVQPTTIKIATPTPPPAPTLTDEQLITRANDIVRYMKRMPEGRYADVNNGAEINRSGAYTDIRDWGDWQVPAGEEDDGDYDWQEPTPATRVKLESHFKELQAKYPDTKIRYSFEEKNYIGVTVERAAVEAPKPPAPVTPPPAPMDSNSLLQKYERFQDEDLWKVTDRSRKAKEDLAAAGYEAYEPRERQRYQVTGSYGTHYTRHADNGVHTTSTYHKKGDRIIENRVVVRQRTHIHGLYEYNS